MPTPQPAVVCSSLPPLNFNFSSGRIHPIREGFGSIIPLHGASVSQVAYCTTATVNESVADVLGFCVHGSTKLSVNALDIFTI
jgi:hypothetical protein